MPAGGGEMDAILRGHDGTGSPLGDPAHWPGSLTTLVGVMLASDQPVFLVWGPARTLLYNDARFTSDGWSPSDFADLCKRGFDELWREGAERPRMMSLGLHPRFIGQAGRTSALREFLEHAQARGEVWFATREEIARHWRETHPPAGT